MKKIITLVIVGFLCLSIAPLRAQVLDIYVSPTGSATGNGNSQAAPVSLSRARTLLKTTANKQRVSHVWLLDGVYTYLSLDTTDSRTANAPVTFHALHPLKAIFQPISPINVADIQPIPDSIKRRIVDSNARAKVRQINLAGYSLSNMTAWPKLFGYPVNITANTTTRQQWPIIYENSTPLPMAQYPNNDVMKVKSVITNGTGKVSPGGSFKYRDDRAKYWRKAIDDGLWLRGNWRVDWQMDFVKTDSINITDSIVYQSIGVQGGIGNKYTRPAGNGQEPYVVVNLVEEIDTVGEWCINFATKMLYIYPPADTTTLHISSNSSTPTIKLDKLNYTNFENILLDGGSADGFRINKCNNVNILGCEVTHVAGYGVFIADGTNCLVKSNNLHDVGEGGVFLINSSFAADQLTLKPCKHQVINNHIYDYAKNVFLYAAAIDTRSVIGAYAAYNNIHGCPHVGVLFGGNNNVFEYNEVRDIVQTYTDMGAFYTSENQTRRGNYILNNYIHAMNYKGSGLYADNNAAGNYYNGNITAQCLWGSQNNYGYFTTFNSNIYYNNFNAHHTNSTNKIPDTSAANTNYTKLKAIYYASTIYKNAYPELKDMFDTINGAYTSALWPQQTGNVFLGTAVSTTCLKGVLDRNLFQASGATNNTYAKTIPFTQYGLVCPSNFLAKLSLIKSGNSNLLDSIKSTGMFSKTANTNWHISRIGLFKDSIYRPDISTTQTEGKAPRFAVSITPKHNYVANDTLAIKVTVYNPNMKNTYTSIALFDKGIKTTLPLTVSKAAFDSVVFTSQWRNPLLGAHTLTAHLYDSTLWEFVSDSVNFTINAPLPIQFVQYSAQPKQCDAAIAFKVSDPKAVAKYFIEQTSSSSIEKVLQINATTSATYEASMPQLTPTANYRIVAQLHTGERIVSPYLNVNTNCFNQEVFYISPNPSLRSKEAQLHYNYAGIPVKSAIRIINVDGKIMYEQWVELHQGMNVFRLPNSQLPTGIYQVVLQNNQVRWQVQ